MSALRLDRSGSRGPRSLVSFVGRSLLVALAASFALEVSLFNLDSWCTRGLVPQEPQITLGAGLSEDGSGGLVVTSSQDAYLELSGINARVDDLYVDVSSCDDGALDVVISFADAAHSAYTPAPQTAVSPSVPLSSYVQLHTAGTSEGVLIQIVEPVGYSFSIGEEVLVSKPIPFVFSIVRFLACAVLIGAVLCLRPPSPAYRLGFTWRKNGCRALAVALCVVEIAALFALSYRGFETNDTWEAHDQYDDLANAFIVGSVSLDKDVPNFFGELDSPYDLGERNAYLASVGDPAPSDSFTDFAYFGDRFYSYFGPLPALELFVPYKLLTGADMPTRLAVLFYGSMFFIFVKVLLLQFSKKMMDVRVSIGAFLLLDLMLCCSSGFLYLGYLPVVYSVPIAASLTHLVAALSCWLLAKRGGEGVFSRPLLAVGALLMALTLGCRQSFVICALLAIPLFWGENMQHRAFFSKKGVLNTRWLSFRSFSLELLRCSTTRRASGRRSTSAPTTTPRATT